MKPTVYKSEDGYSIRGLERSGPRGFPADVHLMWWEWVVEVGLRCMAVLMEGCLLDIPWPAGFVQPFWARAGRRAIRTY